MHAMSRTAMKPTSATSNSSLKPSAPRSLASKLGLAKSAGNDDLNGSVTARNTAQHKVKSTARSHSRQLAVGTTEHGRPVSRVELLLAPKGAQRVYTPPEGTLQSEQINAAIKLAGQWTDISAAVSATEDLSASNVAFALYRLGSIYSFSSSFRQREIMESGLGPKLLCEVPQKLHQMDVGSITLLLDGCARLELKPPGTLMNALANLVHGFASNFEASQLPLVLWAFARLEFVPRSSVLSALDVAAERLSASLTPQGMALTLRGFQSAAYLPSSRTLTRLAEAMQRQLAQFKASEVVVCLDAFVAFEFQLPHSLIAAISQQSGSSVHSNIVSGKPSLGRRASASPVEKPVAAFVEQGSRAAATRLAAAGRMLRSVQLKVEELDGALGPAPGGAHLPNQTYPSV